MPVLQTAQDSVEEPEELVKFREEWKREVQRKAGQASAEAPPAKGQSEDSQITTTSVPNARPQNTPSSPVLHPTTNHVQRRYSVTQGAPPLGDALLAAVDVYRSAVQCEQESRLDEALKLYRKAFRMDSNVDRAYHRMETRLPQIGGTWHHKHSSTSSAGVDELTRAIHTFELSPTSTGKRVSITGVEAPGTVRTTETHGSTPSVVRSGAPVARGFLANLLSTWAQPLFFEPEDETGSCPLNYLPDELLVHILRCLDHGTIEQFALVNRKARVLTLDASIWRDFVDTIYQPPQIADDEDVPLLLSTYSLDFRRMYIEHPRLRLDGVYIAVCHYIRAGQSENVWMSISHLITYHRYLRFYSDGTVLSLLANEELSHQQVIPLLKPSLRMKGFFIGNWHLDGTTVHITDLLDPGGKATRYAFKMTLTLRSRPLGRWNRLDFQEYDSVDLQSGEATPVALKHERPFWFSKVRSYV